MRTANFSVAAWCAAILALLTSCGAGGGSSTAAGTLPFVPQSIAAQSTKLRVQPAKPGYLRGDEKGLRLWGERAQQILISTVPTHGGQTIAVTSSNTRVLKVAPTGTQGTFALQAVTRTDPVSQCVSCKVVTPGIVSLSVTVTSAGQPALKCSVPVRIDHKIAYVSMNPNPNPSIGGIDALLQYYDDNVAPSVIWDDFYLRNTNHITSVGGLAVGADGTLYVANVGNGSPGTVTEYPSGSANPTPVKTLTAPLLVGPQAVAVDAPGNVYVVDAYYESLTRFRVGASPVTLLNNWPSGSGISGVAVDADGDLTVALSDSGLYRNPGRTNVGTLAIVSATFGPHSHPIRQINSSGANGVNEPYGVAVADDANVYVVNDYVSIVNGPPGPGPIYSTLTRYSRGLTGTNTLPDATISAGLEWPLSVAVDTVGTVYVANNTPPSGQNPGCMYVVEYQAGFSNSSEPLLTLNLSRMLPPSYTSAYLNIQGVAVYPGPLQE